MLSWLGVCNVKHFRLGKLHDPEKALMGKHKDSDEPLSVGCHHCLVRHFELGTHNFLPCLLNLKQIVVGPGWWSARQFSPISDKVFQLNPTLNFIQNLFIHSFSHLRLYCLLRGIVQLSVLRFSTLLKASSDCPRNWLCSSCTSLAMVSFQVEVLGAILRNKLEIWTYTPPQFGRSK